MLWFWFWFCFVLLCKSHSLSLSLESYSLEECVESIVGVDPILYIKKEERVKWKG